MTTFPRWALFVCFGHFGLLGQKIHNFTGFYFAWCFLAFCFVWVGSFSAEKQKQIVCVAETDKLLEIGGQGFCSFLDCLLLYWYWSFYFPLCYSLLVFCGDSLLIRITRPKKFENWRSGVCRSLDSSFVRFLFDLEFCLALALDYIRVSFVVELVVGVVSTFLAGLSLIFGGDSLWTMVYPSVESGIKNFGCLPFSRDFWCSDLFCPITLGHDYGVLLEKVYVFVSSCFWQRQVLVVRYFWTLSTLLVTAYFKITWASDTCYGLRVTRIFVKAAVVRGNELITTEVIKMVVDILPFFWRFEFVFLKDHSSLTLVGLRPLLQWHLGYFCFLGWCCCSSFDYLFRFFLCLCLMLISFFLALMFICFVYYGIGWTIYVLCNLS